MWSVRRRDAVAGLRGRRRRRAFTLLELVLVLLLMTVALSIVSPSLRGFGSGSKLRNAARDVVSAMEWARGKSASEGRIFRVRFESGGFLVESAQDSGGVPAGAEGTAANFVEERSDLGARMDLPDGVSATLTKERGEGDYVEFHPDGRTEPGRVELTRGDERIVVISRTPAERFHVASSAEMRGLR